MTPQNPIRQLITQKWFENKASLYELYISVTVIEEVAELKNTIKRQAIKDLILDSDMKVLELSDDLILLANEYMNRGAIPKK
ncbi:hypothetical protein [Candidatus Electrothrix sp.]|uniref:hypothetical protein n=1 Tax=Candidatus Electrothrix sp. TaxID=2170559 RepID=UPI0040578194